MGTVVVSSLSAEQVALYSGMFASLVLCSLVPTQLVYVPSQFAANLAVGVEQLAPDIVGDLRRSWPVILGAGLLACALGLPLLEQTGWPSWSAAAVGLLLFVLASPHQTHARQSLHIVGRHVAAATVSVTTFVLQACGLAAIATQPVDYARLGAIFFAAGASNCVGTILAVWLLRATRKAPRSSASVLVRFGFLGPELVTQAVAYVSILIVVSVMGARTAASLEAARVIASPIQVLVVGLLAFLLPSTIRSLSAGSQAFRRRRRQISVVIGIAGSTYIGLLLLSNPVIFALLGRSASVELASLRAGVTAVDSLATASNAALLARHRVRAVNFLSVTINSVQLGVLPFALSSLGAVGLPLAQLTGSILRVLLVSRAANRMLEH